MPGPGRRWFSVGSSAEKDCRQAGADATRQALQADDGRLLVVFCSAGHDPATVLEGINYTSGGLPLIGCSSLGEITRAGPGKGSVVVTALGGPGFGVATAAASGASMAQRGAGAAVANCSVQVADWPHRVLLLLPDGLARDQEEILGGAYEVVGAQVPLVGGSASPNRASPNRASPKQASPKQASPRHTARRTFQLHGDTVLTDAVVGAAIGSESPFGIGLRHGWRRTGEPMIVTRSAKGRVYTLDDQPAVDMYLRQLGAPEQVRADPVAFDLISRTHPLGVRKRGGEELRSVNATTFLREGWLESAADIPEGALVWLMESDQDSVLGAASDACRAAITALGGHQPLGFLAFDCVSRSDLLGDAGMRDEVSRLAGEARGLPVGGFYSWGEIARVRGINGFHNQTLVILAVS